MKLCFLVLPLMAALALPAYSQGGRGGRGQSGAAPAAEAPAAASTAPAAPAPKVEDKTSTTSHTIQIGGQSIKYTATAGTEVLRKEDGTATASMFYVAYTKDDVADIAHRPITFAFNGGPGSSAVWLEMGMLGPKRVAMDPTGNALPPPSKLVDNEYSILDLTDLVFIDPVSTGFSRAVPESTAANFHGFTGDLQSVGEFIRLYTTRHTRWASPKFLAGESYGTTRAGALSGYLQQTLGMDLNGIVLISSVLNFGAISFDTGNDLPFVTFLPTYAATAWYHKKLAKDLQALTVDKVADEARKYAAGPYLAALFKGDTLTAEERATVVKNVARLTGLSPQFVDESNLRISMQRFAKELLRDERKTVGRYDGRLEGEDRDATGATPEYDPSYSSVQGPFTAAFNQYVRSELKFEDDIPYEILTSRVNPWNYREFENRYVNVAETLRSAMTQNPSLKVFVACGYYDMATPFFSAEYTLDHMLLDPALHSHLSLGYYEAGHMIYTSLKELAKAKQDISKFMTASLP
jgi:carboxypeptidase C (cathepsin A)